MSPSTLRYIKVLADLIEYFGDLHDKDICELGVGYGGQARIIMSMFNVRSYTFIDLDSALSLSKKYLSHFKGIENKLRFICMEDLEVREYDLFLSNYAFSELRRNIQDIYAEKVIKGAKHGYITFNNIEPKNFNYPLEQYDTLLNKPIHIADEIPNSHPFNKILTW
ncbi:putative sugar O-methyltransferase [Helicobacter trogontum]|uniref:Putative sugar O-methyltransferase n=2 Tax=Helicobacter trogontum TaxID=50960 RepID=A0A4U8SDJ7_9HELI|nr:putative sugar O-methyltransferase [Helicobacter trogontum]